MAMKQMGWVKAAFVLAALILAGCSTNVNRTWVNEVKDIPGNWNEADSRQISDAMVHDSIAAGWIDPYSLSLRKVPIVVIGNIRNLSQQHINTNRFVYDLERALVNSGRVNVVASLGEHGDKVGKPVDTDRNVATATRAKIGKDSAADYKLIGSINAKVETSDSLQIHYYQVDLTLVSLADNRIVWTGRKILKKEVRDAGLH
ncbi:MAG TPA: hypothetical protein VMV88_09340 [Gallionella sp.]|nr:hypothetical protein [Gallionella sp.]